MACKPNLLICPYDKSHEIETERMQFHLVKCAKNFPNQEMAACHYNNLHRVPKVELPYHHQICTDKKKLDTFMNEIGDTSCPVKDMVPINEGCIPPCGEDWDSEPPCASALDIIQKEIEEKPVLRALKVSSKAKKKTFHLQERQRITELTDSAKRMTLTPAPQSMPKGIQSKQSTSDAATSGNKGRGRQTNQPPAGRRQTNQPQAGIRQTNQPPAGIRQTNQPPAGIRQTNQPPAGIPSPSSSTSTSNDDFCNVQRPGRDDGSYTLPAPDGFCQLPIPGRGRGRSRNVE